MQNIVFEYLDDNLENVIQIHKKKEKFIEESQIKVRISVFRDICTNCLED